MKEYLTKFIIFLLLISFFIPLSVKGAVVKIENPLKADTFWELMESIVEFLFVLSLFIGALMIVVAAFYFLTSAGDPEKIKTAKNIIIWTLVGIIVLFLSVALTRAITDMLGVTTP